jgi:predicted ATPase/DNA-binding XRE family transcriptional regulator
VSGGSRRPYREFGSWLRSRRLARRWTQEELARRLDYDVTYVRKIEWGERRPSEALQVRLAQVLGVPVSGLPSASPAGAPRPLPETAGPLVDRVEELAAIVDLLDHHTRLVTLVGGPGIGKTRVALAVASHYDALLPGGALLLPLVEVVDAEGVARAVAQILGLATPAGGGLPGRPADAMQSQETLLVLDNFEHVIDAAPFVGQLLAQVPALRILVTSRQPLDLAAETQYPIPPLALPDPSGPPDRLRDVAAVALFVARARKVRPDFTLGPANGADVAEICRRAQGIPLAVEMAAGAMRFHSPKALLDQLGHGLDLPVSGPRDAPEHHRTLRAAIGWSFELLGPHQKTLFSRLAVFAGGCTLESAEAVCRLPDEHVLDARTGLLALASKSLLEPLLDPDGHTRFVTLEAVRAFALEQLAAGGQLERFQARHARWCLALAEATEDRLTGPDQRAALAGLDIEHANLRAAIRWSLEHDPATAIRLCAALWRFWWLRGHLTEGRQWLGEALAGDRDGDGDGARALALTGAGVLARTQGAYGPARDVLEQGRDLAAASGERPTLALALINLGIVSEHQGLPARAMALFGEAHDLYQALGDRRGVAHTLNCMGASRLGQGDLAGATPLLEQALSIFRAVDDGWSAAMALTNLGWAAQQQDRGALARAHYAKALAMYRALGDGRAVANLLLNLGLAIHDAGAGEDVGGLFAEALLGFARQGEQRGVAECLEALAGASRTGDPGRGGVLLGAAETLRETIGAPRPATDRAAHDGLVASVRDALGEGAFDAGWQRGRLLDVDEVVAVAVADAEAAGARGR